METVQKTLHGMQMTEKMMDCFNIPLILPNGRQLIASIQILENIQET